MLAMMPGLALDGKTPHDGARMEPGHLDESAHHFFSDLKTPVFAFNTGNGPDLGTVSLTKANDSNAPATAPKGTANEGAVKWLRLNSKIPTTGNIKAVYRINTAGGNPPTTCGSSPANFSVEYAAEYWFYA
jgi:hypothetical protein